MMPRSWAPVSATNKISVGQTFFIGFSRIASGVIPGGLLRPDTQKEDPFHQDAKELRSVRATARKLGHIKRAFVASAELRPMAQLLLENRTPQAYEGVTAYGRKHAKDDAGPLAWLVIGYAH